MICIKAGNHLYHYSCHLVVASFSEQMNLKNIIPLFFAQTYQKRKEIPQKEMSRDNDQKRKESPYMEKSRDNDQKRCVCK